MRHLTVESLEIIFRKIIGKLKNEGVKSITINTDFYRVIPSDQWDNLNQLQIDNCSLYDDIDSLNLLIENANRPCTYVDFDRLASLLRAISQINNPL